MATVQTFSSNSMPNGLSMLIMGNPANRNDTLVANLTIIISFNLSDDKKSHTDSGVTSEVI